MSICRIETGRGRTNIVTPDLIRGPARALSANAGGPIPFRTAAAGAKGQGWTPDQVRGDGSKSAPDCDPGLPREPGLGSGFPGSGAGATPAFARAGGWGYAGCCSRIQTFFVKMLDAVNLHTDIGREGRRRHPRGAASPSGSRRREKIAEKRTGEVCPAFASRAGNQAREPRRRVSGARAGTGAHARYARIRVPPSAQAGRGERNGTERNQMRWSDCRQDADRRGNRLSSCPERPANTAPAHRVHDKT